MIYVTDTNSFKEQVLSAKGMILVNFWAWWSDECRKMSSLMRKIDGLLDEQDQVVQVDWDRQKELAQELEVVGVPTLLIYIGGREVARYSGTMTRNELVKRIIKEKDAYSSERR